MTSPNYGLLQMGANDFQNALAQGYQIGTDARQRREQAEAKNALAQYATNPSREGLAGVAQYNPEFAIREQDRFAQRDAAQAQKRQADMGTMRQLLQRAGSSPEGWQQAVGAAQQMGLDLSGIPQQYDPQWAEQQLFIMDALSDPETATGVIRDVQALGLDPQTPEGQAAVRELTLYKYAKPVTDEYGRPALSLPTIQTGQQQGQLPQVGQVQDGYRFLGGDPADQNNWQQVMNAAPEISPQELNAMVQREGPQAVQARINRGEFTVRNN